MKKNVASQVIGAQMVSASDGSAFTGSVACYVTGDGGTQALGSVGSGACTHEGNGFHTYAPAQAETNYDHVAFTFVGAGAVPVTVQVFPSFPQSGDGFARLGAPAGASVSADVAAVKGVVDDVLTDTDTTLPGTLATIAGYIDTEVAAILDAVDTEVAAIKAKTDNLPASPAAVGDIPSVGAIADAVWDEALSGHLGSGSTGEALNAAGAAGDPWTTTLPGAYGAGSAGYIVGNNLNAPVGTVDTVVDAIKAVTDNLPNSGALSDLAGDVSEILTDTGTTLPGTLATIAGYIDTEVAAILDAVDTEVAAIKAKTDNLPASPAAVGDIPTASAIADAVLDEALAGHTTAGSLGKAVADIETDATAILADTDELQSDDVPGLIAALNDISPAEVNAEVVDALTVDTYAELASVPAATSSLKDKITWLFMMARNRLTQTSSTLTVRNDANSADVATATVSDDGTTTVRGKLT